MPASCSPTVEIQGKDFDVTNVRRVLQRIRLAWRRDQEEGIPFSFYRIIQTEVGGLEVSIERFAFLFVLSKQQRRNRKYRAKCKRKHATMSGDPAPADPRPLPPATPKVNATANRVS